MPATAYRQTVFAVTLATVAALLAMPASASIRGDADLLRQVAEARQASMATVKTWSGEAQVVDIAQEGDQLVQARTSTVEFWCRQGEERCRWEWKQKDVRVRRGGELVALPLGDDPVAGLVRDGRLYTYDANSAEPVLKVQAWDGSTDPLSMTFHPLSYFSPPGEDIHAQLEQGYRAAAHPRFDAGSVERQGAEVTWRCQRAGAALELTFDMEQGAHLVSYSAASPSQMLDIEWQWQKVNETHLPASFAYTRTRVAPGGAHRAVTRQISFSQSTLNANIETAQFQIDKLGVEPGTKVVDRSSGRTYTWQPDTPGADEDAERAPDFTVPNLFGGRVTLSDYRGQYVLLDFWATWCAPCREEVPHLKNVYEEFGDDRRFEMISLSLDRDLGEPRVYVRRHRMDWTHGLLDAATRQEVTDGYDVVGIPAIMLIGPDGRMLERGLRGSRILSAVRQALAEEDEPETSPLNSSGRP